MLVGWTVRHHPLSLQLSFVLLIFLSPLSLSSPLFSPRHAGPQRVVCSEYQGSTKYKYKYKEEYQESKTHGIFFSHVLENGIFGGFSVCGKPWGSGGHFWKVLVHFWTVLVHFWKALVNTLLSAINVLDAYELGLHVN